MKKTDLNIRDSYKLLESKFVNVVDFVRLCNDYNKFLVSKILEGYEITLPYRLGTMQILGSKTVIKFNEDGSPNLPPDWVKTKQLWDKCPECKSKRQRVFHTNDHTSNVRYKLIWHKKRVIIRNKTLYSFRLTRTNKRDIHKSIINGKEYLVKN